MDDNAENRLKNTIFVVEATSFEVFSLWKENAENSFRRQNSVSWEQMDGWIINVGELYGRPCNISTLWVRIEGQLVMFYYPCSQVADSAKTDKWIDEHFSGRWDNNTRSARCDAMNFHMCLKAIQEKKGIKFS
jgi:hypothetical protein